jgi:hypothetical protein
MQVVHAHDALHRVCVVLCGGRVCAIDIRVDTCPIYICTDCDTRLLRDGEHLQSIDCKYVFGVEGTWDWMGQMRSIMSIQRRADSFRLLQLSSVCRVRVYSLGALEDTHVHC